VAVITPDRYIAYIYVDKKMIENNKNE